MTMGELMANLLGWLGSFIQWVFAWVPRYFIVCYNERGWKYHRGLDPWELLPGVHWYLPNLERVGKHFVGRTVLRVPSLPLETRDAVRVEIGMTLAYRITDVLRYEVDNFHAEDSMDEVAQGMLARTVKRCSWRELHDGDVLEEQLRVAVGIALEPFGAEVLTCQPTDQIRLGEGALRLFGIQLNVDFPDKSQLA